MTHDLPPNLGAIKAACLAGDEAISFLADRKPHVAATYPQSFGGAPDGRAATLG